MLLNGKYPQKFVFNFIRVFTTTQDVSFNELNIRKCLTVKVVVGNQQKSFLQSLQGSMEETNEAFYEILRFGLDTEGGPNCELWVLHLNRSIKTVNSVRLMLHTSKAFVECIEFKNQEYTHI
jgi:hypothetical protein